MSPKFKGSKKIGSGKKYQNFASYETSNNISF